MLFKGGARYGEAFGVVKLPSKKLDTAIEYMMSGKEWDSSIIDMDANVNVTRTELL